MSARGRSRTAAVVFGFALTFALTACAPAVPPEKGAPVADPAGTASTPGPASAAATAPAASSTGPASSRGATDGVIAAAVEAAKGTSATIDGYIVDFVKREKGSESILEVIVMRDGRLMKWATTSLPNRPMAAFGQKPARRATPEAPVERAVREKALAAAASRVHIESPTFAAEPPLVYRYLLSVTRADGSGTQVLIGPAGDVRYASVGKVDLAPWSDASSGGATDLD